MLSHEVLREAAAIVLAGWSEGSAAARDADGREVPLYGPAVGGSSRVAINHKAARFSAYGAVAKVLADRRASGINATIMWQRLSDAARAAAPSRPGGSNHLHPLIEFNSHPDRTAQDVADLLTAVATDLEQAGLAAGRAS